MKPIILEPLNVFVLPYTKEIELLWQILPDPKVFEFKGSQYIALPWKPEVCGIIYENCGVYVRGPAHDWAKFGGRFQPRIEQRVTVDLITQCMRMYVFNGLGTGKTAAAIWATEYMRQTRPMKTLIVTTLTCMHHVWAVELANICPQRSRVVVTGDRNRRQELVETSPDYTIINHDGVKSTYAALKAANFHQVILDEASVYRNDNSELSRQTRELCRGRRVVALTATPKPRDSMDAWGLGMLVNPKRLPQSKTLYKDATMYRFGFDWIDKPGSEEVVYDVLRPAIRIRTEDCVSLPETVFVDREVALTPAQTRAIKTLRKELVYEVAGQPDQLLVLKSASDKVNKIRQAAQGAVRLDETDADEIDCKPSMDELNLLIGQATGKVIVFASYRAVVSRLQKELERRYGKGSTAIVMGGQGAARDREIERFKSDDRCRILIAQPRTMAHGLNLIMATMTIWFGVISDAEIYEQANARMRRPGQKNPMVVAHILRCAEERSALRVCQRRVDEQTALMDRVAELTLDTKNKKA